MARARTAKALHHLRRFRDVIKQVRRDVPFARLVAREACRAADPIAAAEHCITQYRQTVSRLTTQRMQTGIAPSIAGIASLAADPTTTANTLVARFELARN